MTTFILLMVIFLICFWIIKWWITSFANSIDAIGRELHIKPVRGLEMLITKSGIVFMELLAQERLIRFRENRKKPVLAELSIEQITDARYTSMLVKESDATGALLGGLLMGPTGAIIGASADNAAAQSGQVIDVVVITYTAADGNKKEIVFKPLDKNSAKHFVDNLPQDSNSPYAKPENAVKL